jgi:hypothetical protein
MILYEFKSITKGLTFQHWPSGKVPLVLLTLLLLSPILGDRIHTVSRRIEPSSCRLLRDEQSHLPGFFTGGIA